MDKTCDIPLPVIRRMAKYLAQAREMQAQGREWMSSKQLARSLSLTDSTVRQDLSHVDFSGRARRGYEVAGLIRTLAGVLGIERDCRVVIVGAGNLGRALAQHPEFSRMGFDVRGVVDVDPGVVGSRVGGLVVRDMAALKDLVRSEGIEIGVMAVPAQAARTVAFQLASAGIAGILNLACEHVTPLAGVAVVDARLVENLQELSCVIRMRRDAREAGEPAPGASAC